MTTEPSQIEPASEEGPQGSPLGRIVLGVVLVLVGLGWLLETVGAVDIPWRAVLPIALMGVGAVLIPLSWTGGHGGLITLGVIITIVLSLGATVDAFEDAPLSGGFGDRTERPARLVDLDDPIRLAAGDLTVDLRDVDFPEGTTSVEASVGIGQLTVVVPAGVAVDVRAKVTVGELVVLGRQEGSGIDIDEAVVDRSSSATRRVDLGAAVGFGRIEVRR